MHPLQSFCRFSQIRRRVLPFALGGSIVLGWGAALFAASGDRLFFIGNSFTLGNVEPAVVAEGGVPGLVKKLAAAGGQGTLDVQMAASSGLTWEQHLAGATNAVSKLTQGDWDFVIAQDLSTAATDADGPSLEQFLSDGHTINSLAVAHSPGVRVVYYETWARYPTLSIYNADWFVPGGAKEMQRQIRDAYSQLARETGAMVAPVGDAVEKCTREHPEISIYWTDRYHLNTLGSYFAACVIYATIYAADPRGLPVYAGVSATDAAVVQQVAWETVTGFWGWARKAGLGHSSGLPGEDAEGDGTSNLLEYFHGTDPNRASAIPPIPSLVQVGSERRLAIGFKRNVSATDVSVTVERASDPGVAGGLGDWATVGTILGGVSTGAGYLGETGSGPIRTVNFRDIAVGQQERAFLRVVASRDTTDAFPSVPDSGIFRPDDVGGCGKEGSTVYSPTASSYTLRGAGGRIFLGSDQFHFAHRQMAGSGTITARVLSRSNDATKVGVMMRATLRSDSAYAATILNGNSSSFQRRAVTADTVTSNNGTTVVSPWWLRLKRDATTNTFTAERSANGSTWTLIGSQQIPMSDPIEVGLVVCSQQDLVLEEAVFTGVVAP